MADDLGADPRRRVWTIGHSNHPLDVFVALLLAAGIGTVADVRSFPRSRFHPQFNRQRLEAGLAEAGLGYASFGDELGGRPRQPELYDGQGHLRADLVAETPRFRSGIRRLVALATTTPVAVMCSEEDPNRCHRRSLVTPALVELGWDVVHVRGDGRLEVEPRPLR
jgi:uncharacterized protein (DUF488 family)